MNCDQFQPLLQAHHDGELDAANTLQVERHLADCPRCFVFSRNLAGLRAQLAHEPLRFRTPDGLRRNILLAVDADAKAGRDAAPRRASRAPFGVFGAAALIAAFLYFDRQWLRPEDALLAELTSSHVRSLMVTHLTDVTSTDQHTVKPWFDGKLDFAPPVKDFHDSGFPLVGGRLDYLAGRPVAALVYARQKHFVNLFVWPSASGERTPAATDRNGYHLVHWTDHGMNFWAVSDLNEKELVDFANLVSGRH